MITDEAVIERARDWANYHKNPKTRDKMDEALEGICVADQRRVYLCGQRIAAGMTAKVIPAPPSSTPAKAKPVTAPKPLKSSGKAKTNGDTKGKAKATHKATRGAKKGK